MKIQNFCLAPTNWSSFCGRIDPTIQESHNHDSKLMHLKDNRLGKSCFNGEDVLIFKLRLRDTWIVGAMCQQKVVKFAGVQLID